jgi:hypothetical protein
MDAKTAKNLREIMGTDPARGMARKDDIVVGCRGIKVELIDYPKNPYRAIYEGVTATWGSSETWANKYAGTSDKGKLMVILAVLAHKTLPVALEAPKFTFQISGPSRAAFDQIARARIGVGINSIGTRDNDWMDASLRIPHEIANDPEQLEAHTVAFKAIKDAYEITIRKKKESWQAGRFILPMGTCHSWVMNVNYLALQGMMAQRLKFCEMFDCVGTAWLMRQEVEDKFPLLAAFLRPGCDFGGKCQYHSNYALSDLFGALFRGCGRHKVEGDHSAEFNCACSTSKEIADDLNTYLPEPKDWKDIVRDSVAIDTKLGLTHMSEKDVEDVIAQMGL